MKLYVFYIFKIFICIYSPDISTWSKFFQPLARIRRMYEWKDTIESIRNVQRGSINAEFCNIP